MGLKISPKVSQDDSGQYFYAFDISWPEKKFQQTLKVAQTFATAELASDAASAGSEKFRKLLLEQFPKLAEDYDA